MNEPDPRAEAAEVRSEPPPSFAAFRLVNSAHSAVTVGEVLLASTHSNAKFGGGIYFAESEGDLIEFFKSHHGYTYTHVLECRVAGIALPDLFDLVAHPNAMRQFEQNWVWRDEAGFQGGAMEEARAKRLAMINAFVVSVGKKGIRWKATQGWVELVVHEPHCDGAVLVASSDELDMWKLKHVL